MAFRNSPDAILLTEYDSGRILELNEGFERMTGISREVALGRSMVELGGWLDLQERDRMLEILQREGRVEQFEIESPVASGEVLTLSLSAERMDVDGRELTIVTARDISEARRAARKLEIYQQRLKNLVSQLTLAEERVRRGIAVELHDGLCQELAATVMQLTALHATLGEPAQQRLSASIDVLSKSMTSARSMVNRLSRQQLYESGFADALRALVADTASEAEFECVLLDRRDPDRERPDGTESVRIVLYRSVHELLHNVARHAQASHVEVILAQDAASLIVSVTDDGLGMDTDALDPAGWSSSGFGLFRIRQQIESLGGRFELASTPGGGTTITLSVPLGDDDPSPAPPAG